MESCFSLTDAFVFSWLKILMSHMESQRESKSPFLSLRLKAAIVLFSVSHQVFTCLCYLFQVKKKNDDLIPCNNIQKLYPLICIIAVHILCSEH